MATFDCHCCGQTFDSKKPQDPERDKGFGTCDGCQTRVAKDWTKHGFRGRLITMFEARERLARFA